MWARAYIRRRPFSVVAVISLRIESPL